MVRSIALEYRPHEHILTVVPTPVLDHRLLRQFLAVVDAGTVRGAAARLHVSQPPLTQAIKRLEDGLGVELFERRPKGMTATAAGRVLAEEARALLARLERAERRVRRTAEADAPLRIGFVSAALVGVLPALLRRANENGWRVPELREMTTPEQVEALADGRLDIGLLHPPVEIEDLVVHRLERDPFVAALPDGHRLATRRRIRFADIAAEPMVLFSAEQGPSLRTAIERMAFEAGAELDVVAEAARVHSQLAIVAGAAGVGLVARGVARTLAFEGVAFVPISDAGERLFLELAIVGRAEVVRSLVE